MPERNRLEWQKFADPDKLTQDPVRVPFQPAERRWWEKGEDSAIPNTIQAHLFDAMSTKQMMDLGYSEANPSPIAQFLTGNPARMFAAKGAIGYGSGKLADMLRERGHPTEAKVLEIISTAFPALAGIGNMGLVRFREAQESRNRK